MEKIQTKTNPSIGEVIEVNKVKFRDLYEARTGLQIKQDAIAAGVNIKVTYVLDLEKGDEPTRITDDAIVELKNGMKFQAHPGGCDS